MPSSSPVLRATHMKKYMGEDRLPCWHNPLPTELPRPQRAAKLKRSVVDDDDQTSRETITALAHSTR
jgi:hypothetical protein